MEYFRVFENKVLKKILQGRGSNGRMKNILGGLSCGFVGYFSPIIIRVITLRNIKWAGRAARMATGVHAELPQEKRKQLPRRRWRYNIKINLREYNMTV